MIEYLPNAKLPITNVDDAKEEAHLSGEHNGGYFKVLTPNMRPAGGKLGVNLTRVPPGRAVCPFHTHQLEDEVFYVISGTGTLRYGKSAGPIGAGDCISCPAGTGVAHQIANTGKEDLVYLAIGNREPNEVCTYPDSGKVMVRALETVGWLEEKPYLFGEPDPPTVFENT